MTDTVARPQAATTESTSHRKKLIEVALPLEAINREAVHEKSVPRRGHPATLHLWWARRPLAACRAVLFAQLIDDPSACTHEFPTVEAQEVERQRLFRILEEMVKWENSSNETVLNAAREEIARSVARAAGISTPETPEQVQRLLRAHVPPVLDPFCGGGSIPLEAQRLGLETQASDLNPVAVLITKALIEIPHKFKDQAPVNPEDRRDLGGNTGWQGAAGLAADVRYYGKWMRDEAYRRIGHLYPKVKLLPEQGGGEATVVAWLWARTVACPNPACGGQMPLVRSFVLSSKRGKEAWVEPMVHREEKTVEFQVRHGGKPALEGTVNRRGAQCVICRTAVPFDYIRAEGRARRMGQELMAIVAEGVRCRIYLSPQDEQAQAAAGAEPEWAPETDLPEQALGFRVQLYGLRKHADLFTTRQLVALTTFSDLVGEVRKQIREDIGTLPDPNEYADAVATYLAFALSKLADWSSTICSWIHSIEGVRDTFARQAIPMTWDFAETNPLSGSVGNFLNHIEWVADGVRGVRTTVVGRTRLGDAMALNQSECPYIVSTDPPYYDNVPYADLSDFFYVWLRRVLRPMYPDLFSTLLVPKAQELVATPFRFEGGRNEAERFFEQGLRQAFDRIRRLSTTEYPVTVYYAFKQSETDNEPEETVAVSSTGWDAMLAGLLQAGFSITGTWPLRTERTGRLRDTGSNALASSIVLVCRPRPASAPSATRREFVFALRQELPLALVKLQHGNIAPVDLAQASIGPGMAIFSRYKGVLEADGTTMSVRTALQLINGELDAYLAAQEGEMDPDTRWVVAWFEQYGMDEGSFGDAEGYAKAKNTSVTGLVTAGFLSARAGKVRLLRREELDPSWDPRTDRRPTDWECAQHLILVLDQRGEDGAARLVGAMGEEKAQVARDLAYRLYAICERKGWAEEALAYNSLVVAWPAIQERGASLGAEQGRLI